MLVAITDRNERFVINSSIPSKTLKQLRTHTKFYCPQCKQLLQLKIGHVKIPHFAHRINTSCDHNFSDGETIEHLSGKEHLNQLFHSLKLQVQLEPYLSQLKQRPDLLVKKNEKKYAIEYQCSPLSIDRFDERNAGYQSASIHPIWIPLTPFANNQSGIMKVSIKKQLQQFILFANHQQYIMSYSPTLRQFYYLSNLMFVSGNTFIAKVQALPLEHQQFPFYVPKLLSKNDFSQSFNLYHSYKHNYLKSRVLISRRGVQDLFLRSIYELRLTMNCVPSFLGVPILKSDVMQLHAVEWQTAFFYFLYSNHIPITAVNNSTLHYFLKWAKLPQSNKAFEVVQNYYQLIQSLNINHAHQSVPIKAVENELYSQILAIKRYS